MRRAATALLAASLPVLVAAGLTQGFFGGSLAHAVPYVSDEIAYWNQIATFEAAGFHGGYTTVNERPARASFSHFGPHGPVFSILYGLPARLTGWGYASGPLFGGVAFILGAALWIGVRRPPLPAAALLLLTFWPVILAAPNTMQETLHFAIGCALATLIASILDDRAPSSRTLTWVTWGALGVAALVRPVWGLPAIGLGWQVGHRRGPLAGAWGLLAGGLGCGALYLLFSFMAAPYPTAAGGLDLLDRNPLAGGSMLLRSVLDSGRHWLSNDAEPLERFYRLEVLVVAVAISLSALRAKEPGARRVAAVMAVTLWLVLVANLALRNTGSWQDYRTATPVLLMVVLAAAATGRRWTWGIVAAHVLVAPLALATFKDFHAQRYDGDRIAPIERFASSISAHIHYDASLSGWGNTVLIGVEHYDFPLMGLPRGVAVSAVFDWKDLQTPARSRYLLLTGPEALEMSGRMRLRKLTDTPLGGLYENGDWSQ